MRNILATFLVLFLALLLFSCEDEPVSRAVDYEIYKPDSGLHAYMFDQGTYWVYENVFDSVIDSVYIRAIRQDVELLSPQGPGQGRPGEIQYYTQGYTSTVFGTYSENLFGSAISRSLNYGDYTFFLGRSGDVVMNATYKAKYDTLQVGSNTFQNVIRMNIIPDRLIQDTMYLYYVENIGIVKKQLVKGDSVNSSWELIRYSVEMYDVPE